MKEPPSWRVLVIVLAAMAVWVEVLLYILERK